MLLVFCLLSGLPAHAQQDVGYIIGTITDQSGAVIPGAQVTITWQSTGLNQNVTANDTGFYTSQPLQVGQYTVSVKKAGFASATIRNLIVDAAANVQANLVLHPGGTSTSITVEGTPPVMDTTDAEVGATIDTRSAEQLPVNGRSVLALATLTPGVESGVGAVSEGFQNRGTAVSDIRIGGGVAGDNENLLDGVTNTQDWLGEIAINLKSDAVAEYRIMSGVIPAQFGYTSGGVVNVVTRSGSNVLHGSIYEFLRNDAMDAEQSFPRPAFGKQELRFNNYGGTLGGPVLRNKLFLFGNFDGYQFRSAYPTYFTVPTNQEYQGNFSDLGSLVNGVCTPVKIYNDNNIVAGQRQQFSNNGVANSIPTGDLDSVALAYTKLFYPQANNTSGGYNSCTHANNHLYALPVVASEVQGITRGDYRLNQKDSIVGRYAYYLNQTNNGTNGGGFPGIYSHRDDHLRNMTSSLSETHIFTPNLLNDAHIGYMRDDFPFQAASAGLNVAGQIGLPNDTPIEIPQMSNGLIAPNITVGFRASTTIEGIDDVTWLLKNHTLHIGASARFAEGYNNQTGSSASGNFNFTGNTTAQGNDTTVIAGTGSQFASFLLGQVSSASQLVQEGSAFRRMMYAAYVQDDWRVSNKLTVNAGLRWDYMSQAVEKHNGIENFDITKQNPINGYLGLVEYANTSGYGRNFVPENFNDYGPRLGFAYALDPKGQTFLRGGVAIYYTSTDVYNYDESSGNPLGYTSYTTSFTSPTADGYDFHLANGFPGAIQQPLGVNGGYNAFLGQSAAYVQPAAKDPTSQVFTLTVSRELPKGFVVDVTYSGNHGNHFVNNSYNMNTVLPQYYSLGTAALSASVPNPYAGIVPGSLGAANVTQASLDKPYPYMQSVTLQDARQASYWANLGMLSVQRRVSHGLQIIGAYTRGKVTDEGIAGVSDLSALGTGTSAGPQNWRNLQAEHSLDTIDVRNRLVISGLYDLPFGKGHRINGGPASGFISGWQYNAILTIESGRPIAISGANNQLATRPNFNPNVSYKVQHQSRSVLYKTGQLEWFNPQAFVNPPDYTFGNVPRTMPNLSGPGTVNMDMSLFKTTHLYGPAVLELRIEAYNALNHPNLPMPGTGFSAGPPAVSSNPYAEGGFNTSSSFGMITSGAVATRNIQLGAKVSF